MTEENKINEIEKRIEDRIYKAEMYICDISDEVKELFEEIKLNKEIEDFLFELQDYNDETIAKKAGEFWKKI